MPLLYEKHLFWRDRYSAETQTLYAAMLSVHRTGHVIRWNTLGWGCSASAGIWIMREQLRWSSLHHNNQRLRTGWSLNAPKPWKLGGAFACRMCANADSVWKAFFWRDLYCPQPQRLFGHNSERRKFSLLLSAKYIKWEPLRLQSRHLDNGRTIPSAPRPMP